MLPNSNLNFEPCASGKRVKKNFLQKFKMPVPLNIDAKNMYLIPAKEAICIKDQESDFALVLYLFRVSSDNNATVFQRVMAQVLHQHGGEKRCPWTRAVMEGTLSFT